MNITLTRKNKYLTPLIILRSVFVLCTMLFMGNSNSCLGQEITRLKYFPRNPYSIVSPVPPDYTKKMYEHEGKYYWMIEDMDNRFNMLIEELEIHEFDNAINPNNNTEVKRSHILLEYTPGEGFTDYVLFNHGQGQDQILSFDGDNLLVVSNSSYLAIQDSIIVGHVDSSFINTSTQYFTYVVYNMRSDTIVSTYSEIRNDYNVLSVGLKGDYIYTVSFNFFKYGFMGDTLDLFDPSDVYSSNTHISRVNHVTAEKEWSYHIGDTAFGNYGYLAKDIRFDEEGNAIVVVRSREPSQYKGEYLNDMWGVYDIEFYKINASGDLLNHQRMHGPYDEVFRDYKLNSDGSVDVFGRTQYPQTISIGQDTFTIVEEGFRGIAFHLNKEWELQWMKSYNGTASTTLTAMNSYNGESILTVPIKDTLFLEDVTLVNPYIDDTTSTLYTKSVDVLIKYDKEGARLGTPILYGYGSNIYELFEIEENKYFFFLEGEENYPTFDFLGEEMGLEHQNYFVLMEIEGDLFDVLSTVNQLQNNRNDFVAYPNPVRSGQRIILENPIEIFDPIVMIRIYNSDGTLEMETTVEGGIRAIEILTNGLAPGLKHLTIKSGNNKITQSIIIH